MTRRLATLFPTILVAAFLLGIAVTSNAASAASSQTHATPYPIQRISPTALDRAVEIHGRFAMIDPATGTVTMERHLTVKNTVETYTERYANVPPERLNRTIQYLSELRNGAGDFIGEQYYAAKSETAVYNAATGNHTYETGGGSRANSRYATHQRFIRRFIWPITYQRSGVVGRNGDRLTRYTVDAESSGPSIVSGDGYILLQGSVLEEANLSVLYEDPVTGTRTRWNVTYRRAPADPFQPPAWVAAVSGDRIVSAVNDNAAIILESDDRYINAVFLGEFGSTPIPTDATVTLVTDTGRHTTQGIRSEGISSSTAERDIANLYLFLKDDTLEAVDGDRALTEFLEKTDTPTPLTTLGTPQRLVVTHGRVTYINRTVYHADNLNTTVTVSWLQDPADGYSNEDALHITRSAGHRLLDHGDILIRKDGRTVASQPHEQELGRITRTPDNITLPVDFVEPALPITDTTRLVIRYEGGTMVNTALPPPP